MNVDCNQMILDLGGMGNATLTIIWSDHNNVKHVEYVIMKVIDGKPSILDIQRVEILELNGKEIEI